MNTVAVPLVDAREWARAAESASLAIVDLGGVGIDPTNGVRLDRDEPDGGGRD